MHAGDPSSLPNPFAVELNATRRGGRKAMISALKFLLMAALALAVVLVIGSQSRRWLLDRLTQDFDSLSQPQKQQRLVQMADCGAPAIPFLVRTLADSDPTVARTAYDLLRESQNDWTLLQRDQRMQQHSTLVSAIDGVAATLPEDRSGWTASLLQQTILEAVEDSDEASRHLHADATDVLAKLSLSAGEPDAQDPALDDEQGTGGSSSQRIAGSSLPVRVVARPEPLPVSSTSTDTWTHWPPGREQASGSAATPRAAQTRQSASSSSPDPESPQRPASGRAEPDGAPSIYRSSASQVPAVRLRPIAPDQRVTLREIDQTPGDAERQDALQPTAHLVDSPLETLNTRSVIYWLGGADASLRDQARAELRRRGLNETQLSVASRLAGGDLTARLALVESLAHSDEIDPRPWLLMLMDDRSRDVKVRALSVLATMRDSAITKELQDRLARERDPTVAARIRKVLELR